MFGNSELKKMSKELKRLYSCKQVLMKKYENAVDLGDNTELIDKDIDELEVEIDAFIENEYALAVFEKYSKTKPDLIRIKTGEIISWEDGFGMNFNKISKSLRHSLVGLVEEPGRYKIM